MKVVVKRKEKKMKNCNSKLNSFTSHISFTYPASLVGWKKNKKEKKNFKFKLE